MFIRQTDEQKEKRLRMLVNLHMALVSLMFVLLMAYLILSPFPLEMINLVPYVALLFAFFTHKIAISGIAEEGRLALQNKLNMSLYLTISQFLVGMVAILF